MDNLKWHPPGKTPPVGIPLWLHTHVGGERPYIEAVRFAWICCPSGRNFSDDEIKQLYEAADLYSAELKKVGN